MKQHELLASKDDLTTKFNNVRTDSKKIFSNVSNFSEHNRVYKPFDEKDKDLTETDSKCMITTVNERLSFDDKFAISNLNCIGKKELTNKNASADIVIIDEDTDEKTVICKNVPVTLLLEYQKCIQSQLDFYNCIPTIDMNTNWVNGKNSNGKDCFESPETNTIRKVVKKTNTSFNPNPPDGERDKFPLQPITISEDVAVGNYTMKVKSGCITPSEKNELLERCEKLLIAVKSARANANEAEVVDCTYGKQIMNYLNNR